MSNLPHYHYSGSLSTTKKKKNWSANKFYNLVHFVSETWLFAKRIVSGGLFFRSCRPRNAHFHYWTRTNKSKLNLGISRQHKKKIQTKWATLSVEGWEFLYSHFLKGVHRATATTTEMNGIKIEISWATINQKNWKLWFNDKACNCEKSKWLYTHKKALCFSSRQASSLQLYTQRHYITLVDLFFFFLALRKKNLDIFLSPRKIHDFNFSHLWQWYFIWLAHFFFPASYFWDCFVASRKSLAGISLVGKRTNISGRLNGKIAFRRDCKLKIIEVINCCLLLAYFTPFSPLSNFENSHHSLTRYFNHFFRRFFLFFQFFFFLFPSCYSAWRMYECSEKASQKWIGNNGNGGHGIQFSNKLHFVIN